MVINLNVPAILVTLILMLSSLVYYPLRTPMPGAIFAIACVEMAHALCKREEAPGKRNAGA